MKALLILLLFLPLQVFAQEATPDDSDLSKQKFEAIQKEIDNLRFEANHLSVQEQTVLTLLDEFNVDLRMNKQEIELLDMKQKATGRQIQELGGKFDVLQKNLEKQKAYLEKRLVDAYKLGQLNYLKLLLQVNTASDLMRGYQYVTFLAKDDNRKVRQYRDSLQEMEEMRVRLEQENRNLARLKQDSELAQSNLMRNREEKIRLLTAIQEEKETHLSALSELKAAAGKLKKLFVPAEPPPSASPVPAGTPLERMKGQLDWPVRGKVVLGFGPQKHPKFGTVTVNNGIEISAEEGRDVYAVADGTVVFAEWFKGYGKLVILSHPGGYYTLYAHDSDILVQRGDAVEDGQIIAKVGDTGGTLNQPSLYFEIRDKDQPVDPATWLRKY